MTAMRAAAVRAAMSGGLQPAFAQPQVDVDTRCFQVTGRPDRRVELRRFFADRGANSFAFVRHGGSRKWIPLVPAGTRQVPTGAPDRVELDIEWIEVVDGQVGGRYFLVSEGAEIVGFDDVDRKTGKGMQSGHSARPAGDPCSSRGAGRRRP